MKPFALSQLPERFQRQPRSAALQQYIEQKYSRHGFKKDKSIHYNPEWKPTYTSDRYRWIENVTDGLRFVDRSDKIIRLGHTGWFNDNHQDETVHGEVYQLPARDGQPQYVAAVNDPCNDNCAAVNFSEITNEKEDAARWADRMAEMWAEDSRESQAKEDAEQRIADIEDEIKETYASFRQMSRELRANCDALKGVSVVWQLVRKEWKQTRATIHKLREEKERIQEYGIEY